MPSQTPIKLLSSTTFRLASLYVVLFAGSLFVLLVFVYWSSVGYMRDRTDDAINTEFAGLAERYAVAGTRGVSQLITDRLARYRPTSDSVYLLVDPRGRRVSGNLNRFPEAPVSREVTWIEFSVDNNRDEARPVRARTLQLPNGFALLIGRDINALVTIERRLRLAIQWAAGIALFLGILGAFLMTRSVMRRIEIINITSQSIVRSGDLSRRVPHKGSSDEFDALAANLNHMLARIEELMTGVRRVSDSIAHDLRTPLARLRNRLEIMQHDAAIHDAEVETIEPSPGNITPGVSRAMLESALAETDQLLNTFNALLRIARIESGDAVKNFRELNLASLLDDVVELYEPIAEDAGIKLKVTGEADVIISGDRDLIFQAVVNLVDNAIKFSPQDSSIRLDCESNAGRARLSVVDEGPGIPVEQQDVVFQRFYRIDNSRSSEGNGLGLALVRAVVDLHEADISLSSSLLSQANESESNDENPGLTVSIDFVSVSSH